MKKFSIYTNLRDMLADDAARLATPGWEHTHYGHQICVDMWRYEEDIVWC